LEQLWKDGPTKKRRKSNRRPMQMVQWRENTGRQPPCCRQVIFYEKYQRRSRQDRLSDDNEFEMDVEVSRGVSSRFGVGAPRPISDATMKLTTRLSA